MYTVPELEYGYGDLARAVSKEVMTLHHDKHHQTYVDKLNAALKDHPELAALPVDELLRRCAELPDEVKVAVRNHGGGHYNHTQFWTWMSPQGGGEPGGALKDALDAKYGAFQAFTDAFNEKALGVFGSGWAWLMPDASIVITPNQDSPLIAGGEAPLLGLDVWEHAYYLDYKHLRADYVKAWWDVVDWKRVEEAYAQKK